MHKLGVKTDALDRSIDRNRALFDALDDLLLQHLPRLEPHDHQAHQYSDDVAHKHARQAHGSGVRQCTQDAIGMRGRGDGVKALKLFEGGHRADQHHRVHDRRGQHVGHCAAQRQPLLNEATNHGNDGALADRENEAQKACHDRRQALILRQDTLQEFGGKKSVNQPRQNGSQQDVGSSFKHNAEEGHEHVAKATRFGKGGEKMHLCIHKRE